MVFGLTGPIAWHTRRWIMYWVQMAQYGKRLREGQRGYASGSVEEDYDDQYRRPRYDDEEYKRRDDDDRRHRRPRDDDDRPRRDDD